MMIAPGIPSCSDFHSRQSNRLAVINPDFQKKFFCYSIRQIKRLALINPEVCGSLRQSNSLPLINPEAWENYPMVIATSIKQNKSLASRKKKCQKDFFLTTGKLVRVNAILRILCPIKTLVSPATQTSTTSSYTVTNFIWAEVQNLNCVPLRACQGWECDTLSCNNLQQYVT